MSRSARFAIALVMLIVLAVAAWIALRPGMLPRGQSAAAATTQLINKGEYLARA